MSDTFDPYRTWLGIESAQRPVDAYTLLHLDQFESDQQRILQAVQRQMMRLRPHAKGPHSSEAKSLAVEIASAKTLLINPTQKGAYDVMLRKRAMQDARKMRRRIAAVVGLVAGAMVIGVGAGSVVLLFGSASAPSQEAEVTQVAVNSAPSARDGEGDATKSAELSGNSIAEVDPAQPDEDLSTAGDSPAPATDTEDEENDDVPAIISRAESAVVRIEIESGNEKGVGSGFLADDKGTIVTNLHVVENATRVTVVWSDGTRHPARGFVAADPAKDLAAIRAFGTISAAPITLAKTLPRKGERVLALGAPRGFSFSATEGMVSGVRSGQEVSQILKDLSGKDVYALHGLAPDVTWIQSTAAISGGNSGGPLLNGVGEVVAINTWTHGTGHSLNFALSVDDIKRFLTLVGDEPRPFSELVAGTGRTKIPGSRAAEAATSDRAMPPRDFRVELPSGRILTNGSMVVPESQLKRAFPEKAQKLTLTHENGAIAGVFTFKDGRLDGATASFHPNGQNWVFATYKDSKREGAFRAWDEDGARILWAEFKYDRKDGPLCLFQNDAPWLVQEYDKGNLLASYLVSYEESGDAQVLQFADIELAINEEAGLGAAITELERLEEQMKLGEQEIKRTLSTWYRDERKRLYREARMQTAEQRAAQSRHEDAASVSAAQGAINDFIRRASGR